MRTAAWLASMVVASGCSLIVPGPGDLRPTGDGGGQRDGGGDHVDAAHHVDAGHGAGMHVQMDAGRDGGMDGGTDGGPACDAPLELCGGACVDTQSDLANCGACGNACAETDRCNAGTCYDPVVEVAAGYGHTCARRASGHVWCWGVNWQGQLGDGTMLNRLTPVEVIDLDDAEELSAAYGFVRGPAWGWSCARRVDGSVVCWGDNSYGELGDGTRTDSARPVAVAGLGAVLRISTGELILGCGISVDHQLYCWGGLDSMSRPLPPAPLAPDGVSGGWVTDVDMGFATECAVGTAGEVYCWGSNTDGQVGLAPSVTTSQPVPIQVAGITGVTAVTQGRLASCALRADGTVACWGRSDHLGAGLGTTDPHPDPVEVSGLVDVVAIDGLETTCAIHGDDHRVSCWGDTLESVPGLTDVVDIAVGYDHYCAVRDGGSVVCWGGNAGGQLGDGTTEDRATPTPVVGLP